MCVFGGFLGGRARWQSGEGIGHAIEGPVKTCSIDFYRFEKMGESLSSGFQGPNVEKPNV